MPKQPLAEVFGFPIDNFSPEAARHRHYRLCPFNNRVPNCTKDKANDPLGVCSVFGSDNEITITCPIRFREDWAIAVDAAKFFFPSSAKWTSLTEIRLNNRDGNSAGNIDVVLVSYDERGRIEDFGSLEVQAVYISGNIRRPFEYYMADPPNRSTMEWDGQPNYPRPDYLSSSRKRLAPQLIFKGGILKSWGKKQAVALDRKFFNTLPPLEEVSPEQADISWLIYDLIQDAESNRYKLMLHRTVYTEFKPALDRITTAQPGSLEGFVDHLQSRLDEILDAGDNPPDTASLNDLL